MSESFKHNITLLAIVWNCDISVSPSLSFSLAKPLNSSIFFVSLEASGTFSDCSLCSGKYLDAPIVPVLSERMCFIPNSKDCELIIGMLVKFRHTTGDKVWMFESFSGLNYCL